MTTRVNLSDLGPRARAQVQRAVAIQVPNGQKRRRRGGSVRGGRWRCHTCGLASTTWAGAERHADELGHHRIEVVLS